MFPRPHPSDVTGLLFSRHTLNRFLRFIRSCGEPQFREFVENVREQADLAKPYLDAMEDAVDDFVEDLRARDWNFEWPSQVELPSFNFGFGRENSEEE